MFSLEVLSKYLHCLLQIQESQKSHRVKMWIFPSKINKHVTPYEMFNILEGLKG